MIMSRPPKPGEVVYDFWRDGDPLIEAFLRANPEWQGKVRRLPKGDPSEGNYVVGEGFSHETGPFLVALMQWKRERN
jgi:hypothetical protein